MRLFECPHKRIIEQVSIRMSAFSYGRIFTQAKMRFQAHLSRLHRVTRRVV